MQAEKPTSDRELAGPPAFGERPEPADDGLPLHATASTARVTAAMTTVVAAPSRWCATGLAGCRFIGCSDQVVEHSAPV
jgi:hypothetical protein